MKDYCATCNKTEQCELAHNINFCIDCKEYFGCPVRTESCENYHYIECNNGFEIEEEE